MIDLKYKCEIPAHHQIGDEDDGKQVQQRYVEVQARKDELVGNPKQLAADKRKLMP